MKITITELSALAGEIHTFVASIPPFPPTHKDEVLDAAISHSIERLGSEANVRAQSFPLSEEDVLALAKQLTEIQLSPSPGSFSCYEAKDGWTTELKIDSCDSKIFLSWFLHAPPEWIGVDALCKAVRTLYMKKSQPI